MSEKIKVIDDILICKETEEEILVFDCFECPHYVSQDEENGEWVKLSP